MQTSMQDVRFSPRALILFCLAAAIFGGLVAIDKGTGPISRAWPIVLWSGVAIGSVLVAARLWRARRDGEQLRRAEAKGVYGLLPPKVRDWLFS